MKAELLKRIKDIQSCSDFSGTVLVKAEEVLAAVSYGYANRSEKITNKPTTRFGIASGCKLFTGIAICQLVDEGKIAFDMKLNECLDVPFPHFSEEITIHHLLTHTSGIPDYFDEEVMDDFEELWIQNPMYRIRSLKDFLPLFQNQSMKYRVGERFHYNNAGYIVLGLIVEQASQMNFTDYVQENIFKKANVLESGYFELDSLPSDTAQGYIDYPDHTWKTNIYSLPVKGGSDGGAFVTVNDMVKLWEALMSNQLLSESTTKLLLTPHAQVDDDGNWYGYGVWIKTNEKSVIKYHVMGYDPGVSFHSAFYPTIGTKVVVCSNKSEGAYEIMQGIENEIKVMTC
ncbi:serine hydrolase domain-containing protein [Bacillus niameyensis]|uniref:serine hydrolase domain-containing protein n=1 Tax=Bacillus niameyensis TaxID=1522308 RepID=UPI0007850D35|nr:serine hydrolase [Bacillus niameyensis]